MAEPIHDKIKRFLQAAEGLYHRLVLLVGESGSGKTGVLRDIAEEFGSSVVNLSLALSGELFSDINPQFMQQLGGWSKKEAQLDLRELLNQNFLCYDGKGPVPEQIHAYLATNWKELRNLPKDDPALVTKALDRWYVPDSNKVDDLEKLREKALLKEFEEYKEVKNLAGARLRSHRRRGRQDPRQRPGRRPQTAHVVRPGGTTDGRGMK